ncbi:Regulator of ribonuclease activity A [Rhynchospora pubera]|uniref:Regulator of ribonuclease activity A n=1 Tax=Rhynchospora pubera TaxID=906938 RepID=A0AAV8CDR9_9POAL|nr:Regulator of ribonuclease activity A [Rhynchospora pubera]
MDQPGTLLPLSSQTPTPTLNPIKPPLPTSSNPKISATVWTDSYPPTPLRLATLLALLLISVWANYEASKGFDLTILNAPTYTLAGRRFNLLFVSNGRAADMALKSSRFIEHVLYPLEEAFPRKPVRHVTIRLADDNITNDVIVSRCNNRAAAANGEYLIEISPSVMARKDVITEAFSLALQRGMAFVWLWDGYGTILQPIIDAMVQYLSVQYKFANKDYESNYLASTLAGLIQLCEERSSGFVARLNNAVREKWDEHTLTAAFSSPYEIMCLSRIISVSEDGFLPDNAGLDLNWELNQAM